MRRNVPASGAQVGVMTVSARCTCYAHAQELLAPVWKRLAEDGASLGFSPAGRVLAALLAPVARLVDPCRDGACPRSRWPRERRRPARGLLLILFCGPGPG